VLQEYRQYVCELAKVRIANPNIRFRLPEGKPYNSVFLNELRNRRDQEFKGRFEPHEMPIWARELAICLRRMELLRYSQRSEFERQFSAIEEEEQRRRVHEVARHSTGASSAFRSELERPARFYRAVAEREFASFGFSYDIRRSIGEYVVLSKPLAVGWDLCLTPEPLDWYPGRKDGKVSVVLSLQSARHHRPMRRAKWEQILVIEYVELVPYFDFCYKRFASLDELETIVIARAFLLSLAINEIGPRLLAGLAKFL
jgi:hypothetical protein